MQKLNLPNVTFHLERKSGKVRVFDVVRKKYVVLTPEEWVRQHMVHYLHNEKGVPYSLMMLEQPLKVALRKKRSDITIFSNSGQSVMIVECKAAGVKINQMVFDQIVRYNMALKVKFLLVTNGMSHYCCEVDYEHDSYRFVEGIPDYATMIKE